MGAATSCASESKEDKSLREHIGMDNSEVEDIVKSWEAVRKFGAEQAGIILFKKVFAAAPETLQMFEAFRDIPDYENSKEFKHHCKIVMNIVGSAVGLLRDPESLDSTLEYLGLKHDGFGITQAHFDLMGGLMMETLREAIGSKFTPAVEKAWLKMYNYTAKLILDGMSRMEKLKKNPEIVLASDKK